MIDISTLNPAQLEAVTAPDGPVLVIAGAGSGKTRTIVHRLAWLAEQGVPASDMLLLTFTRKASREMLLRATDLLGYSIGGVHGGTFHSFAFSVLRQYRPAWAEGPVTVMDSADSASAIQQCKERLKVGKGDRSFPKTQTIIGLLSKARNKEISIGDVLQRDAQHLLPHADALESIGEAYRGYRHQHGLLDYDDLLFELEDLLKGDPEAGREGLAERFRERYRYIMVDEYQDTNRVQARLVRLLAGEAGNVMAVGDDAQSIYAFRGADVRNILDFPKLFPGTRVIRLEENYRSTQPVLDVANAVLAPASEGFRKNLFTTKENTPKTPRVRLVRPMSDLTQANVVAARVEELLDRYQAKEIAVLFRAGYQSYHLEVALSKRGIKFRKYGGLRYAEAVHVKDVVAFVRLAINPLDMPSFERVAGLSKGVGTKTAEKIYHVAAQGDFDALRKACTKYPDLWSDMLLLDKLREHNLTPAALIEMVIEHYTPRLQAIFPDDWPRRQQGLSELAHIASAYTDLEQFVADLSLETPEDDADEFDEAGRWCSPPSTPQKGWNGTPSSCLIWSRTASPRATRWCGPKTSRRNAASCTSPAPVPARIWNCSCPPRSTAARTAAMSPRRRAPSCANCRSAPLRSGRRATRAASPSAAHPSPEIPPFRGLLWIFPANWPTPTPGASKACSRPRSSPRRKAIGPHPRAARGAAIAGIRYSGAARSWNSFRPTSAGSTSPASGSRSFSARF